MIGRYKGCPCLLQAFNQNAAATNAINGQRLIAADVTKVVGANVKDTSLAAAPATGMSQVSLPTEP